MKIAIIGAGAIGGYVGVKLALAGEDVTFVVRGANLDAIRKNGMKLVMSDGSEHVARGSFEEFQDGLVFERRRIRDVHDHLRSG